MESDNLIGLENLMLNQELSAEEYFTIVVSTCENDLNNAKSAVAKVLKKIKPHELTYQTLKNLYDEFFQEEFSINENSTELKTDDVNKPASSNDKRKKKNNKKKNIPNSHKQQSPVILWFRRDLRLYDNPALFKAAFDEKGQERPVIPVFIWNENEENEHLNNGGAVKVWLQRALEELDKSLAKHYDSHLILRKGSDTTQILFDLLQESGAKTVIWTTLYEPWILDRDEIIQSKLKSRGIQVHIEHSYLLHRPDEVVVCDSTRGKQYINENKQLTNYSLVQIIQD